MKPAGAALTLDNVAEQHSSRLRLKFSGLVFAEIRGRGSFEALLAVNGGVDITGRKKEPILSGIRRRILQTLHFTEVKEDGRFLHGGFALCFAGGLERLQQGEVLLNGAVQPLLVEREELELFRLHGENARGREGGIDLFVVGELAAVLVEARAKRLSSTALIRLSRQLSVAMRWASWISMAPSGARLWIRAWENLSWAARSSSVIVVTWPVRPWRSALSLERFLPSSVGPVDRRALLRFASSCLSEIIITYLAACSRFLITMREREKAGA